MLKKSFVGLKRPRLEYPVLKGAPAEPKKIYPSKKVTLLANVRMDQKDALLLKVGEAVRTGQKLALTADADAYVISSVTGTVSSISSYETDFGKTYTAVSIDVAKDETIDEEFAKHAAGPTLDIALKYLTGIPGRPPLELFADPEKTIHTIVINGMDGDLLIETNQHALVSGFDAIKNGILILKQITGIENVIVAVPRELVQGYGHIGATMKAVDTSYPAALPQKIMQDVLGQVLPAGKKSEDVGICFFNAESVKSLGRAFGGGRIPVSKTLTLIKKDGSCALVKARIGTPLSDIFNAFDIALSDKDRLIIGGPMRGAALYTEAHPVCPDTDAVMVQDRMDLPLVSDYPCINCGECVRICPAKMQVNMLVRFLEAGQYEQGAEEYDLYSCIECGLCSFVCASRIPIFQYIRLAKYELGRLQTAEATNE